MIGCLPTQARTQALAFLAVFVYATHATQAIAFEWKPGLSQSTYTISLEFTGLCCCEVSVLLYFQIRRFFKYLMSLLQLIIRIYYTKRTSVPLYRHVAAQCTYSCERPDEPSVEARRAQQQQQLTQVSHTERVARSVYPLPQSRFDAPSPTNNHCQLFRFCLLAAVCSNVT